jgi:hypothetical protein
MKNNAFLVLIGILCLFGQLSCNSGANQDQNANQDSSLTTNKQSNSPDYSGVYKTSAESACQLSITITKQGQDFNYQLAYNNKTYTGKVIIEDQEGTIYFSFDGKIEENEAKSVGGQFIDGKIMIQNYGNAMNEFQLFKSCDEKYLEFIKS